MFRCIKVVSEAKPKRLDGAFEGETVLWHYEVELRGTPTICRDIIIQLHSDTGERSGLQHDVRSRSDSNLRGLNALQRFARETNMVGLITSLSFSIRMYRSLF